jgi:hypothetical protein
VLLLEDSDVEDDLQGGKSGQETTLSNVDVTGKPSVETITPPPPAAAAAGKGPVAAADVPEGVLQARQPLCDNVDRAAGEAAAGAGSKGGPGAQGLSSGCDLLQAQVAGYELSAVVRHKGPLASSGHFVADVKNSKVSGGEENLAFL